MHIFTGMQLFPVEYSSLSAVALLEFIKSCYQVGQSASILFLKRGFNDTYLITCSTGKFILRVYKHKWRTLASIEAEMELLLLLQSKGVYVSVPIRDTGNRLVQTILAPEGVRFAVLFSYAEGGAMKKLNAEQAFSLGVAGASIHLQTKDLNLQATAQNYDPGQQFRHTLEVLSPILREYPRQFKFLQKLEQRFLEAFSGIDKELPSGICHGDLQAENFHLTTNNRFTFFDFDFFGTGYLVYDIGVFMWYDHKNKPAEIMKAFLHGYESRRVLTATEHWAIPWLSALRAVFQMTMYCRLSDGKQLPLWPPGQVADFVDKVEKWMNERTSSRTLSR